MREMKATWGSAMKVAWSIGWRAAIYLIPAYVLAYAVMVAAMMAGDAVQGSVPWLVAVYYVLRILWAGAVALAFLLAVKGVIGKSYLASSFPPVKESFRITLVTEEE